MNVSFPLAEMDINCINITENNGKCSQNVLEEVQHIIHKPAKEGEFKKKDPDTNLGWSQNVHM